MNSLIAQPIEPGGMVRTEPTPMALMQLAIEKGAGVGELERLVALQERYEAIQAKRLYVQAMAACQAAMPVIVRNATNNHTNKKYVNLEGIVRQARPVYMAHGFSLSFNTTDCPIQGYMRCVCLCSHTGGHTESFQIDLAIDGTGAKGGSNMTALQGAGSTMSYAERYLTQKIFNLVISDADEEGKLFGKIPIGPEQLAELEAEIAKRDMDAARTAKFINFMNIPSGKLEDMPGRDFHKAMQFLKLVKEKAGAA